MIEEPQILRPESTGAAPRAYTCSRPAPFERRKDVPGRPDMLLAWLRTRSAGEASFREMLQFGPAPLRSKTVADDALAALLLSGSVVELSRRPRRFGLATVCRETVAARETVIAPQASSPVESVAAPAIETVADGPLETVAAALSQTVASDEQLARKGVESIRAEMEARAAAVAGKGWWRAPVEGWPERITIHNIVRDEATVIYLQSRQGASRRLR